MGPYQQIPLVGPGSELQLTLDGRAVPHADVVGASERPPARYPETPRDRGEIVPEGQTSL